MHTKPLKLFICMLISIFFCNTSTIPTAQAAVIETTTYIDSSQHITVDDLDRMLEQKDVQEKLICYGK